MSYDEENYYKSLECTQMFLGTDSRSRGAYSELVVFMLQEMYRHRWPRNRLLLSKRCFISSHVSLRCMLFPAVISGWTNTAGAADADADTVPFFWFCSANTNGSGGGRGQGQIKLNDL